MAIPRRPGPAQTFSLSGKVPDAPRLPETFINRFPELQTYQTKVTDWWNSFVVMFQRDRSEITLQLSSLKTSVESQITALQTAVSTLQSQVAALTGADLSGIQAQIQAITQQLAVLNASLTAHVNMTSAHGTTSAIVGVSDAQVLDNKQLGVNNPGYGRVTAGIISLNRILSAETIKVGTKDTMLVAGPLTISGQLVIEGRLVAV